MAEAERCFSPRLGALCQGHESIAVALAQAEILSTQDLSAFAPDADIACDRLKLPEDLRGEFVTIFCITKARDEGTDEERMNVFLDVMNAEGDILFKKTRGDIHRNGFWHRAMNVWLICPSTSRVLMGQRSASKDMDPRKWTCVCGRVPTGELSMTATLDRLVDEFSIEVEPDTQLSLIFSMKHKKTITRGFFAGQEDATWLDIYVAQMNDEIPVEKLQLNPKAKQAAKWISLEELQRAILQKDDNYVQLPTDEYAKKLLHYLKTVCRGADYKPWHAPSPGSTLQLATLAEGPDAPRQVTRPARLPFLPPEH
eukprot:TRINITY_DN35782_c0_g1_i1.p1 TRINITY_DN35782_c0_g1~~TRINITY_DN35782_c0_g1_i1.p1  ORF type:complete len:312 (-),score=51.72 TRINITY_DN35782_c0_g1_i1:176-1111(-)